MIDEHVLFSQFVLFVGSISARVGSAHTPSGLDSQAHVRPSSLGTTRPKQDTWYGMRRGRGGSADLMQLLSTTFAAGFLPQHMQNEARFYNLLAD